MPMGHHCMCLPCPPHASHARRDDERDADFVADDAEAEDEGAPGRHWASVREPTVQRPLGMRDAVLRCRLGRVCSRRGLPPAVCGLRTLFSCCWGPALMR